jgi:branched-chain amino acid transport system substrate-binding protein
VRRRVPQTEEVDMFPAGLRSAVLASVALTATACGQKAGDRQAIVIGEFGSLSGENAAFGASSHNGVVLAIDEINAAGGVLGKQVRIVVEDNQSRTEQVSTIVKKLIDQDKVCAVLGEVASSRSMAGSTVCESAGIPMVSPSSTNPDVTVDKRTGLVKPFTFRVCFIDPFQGTVMARFAHDNLGLSRVAVLLDVKQDYSQGLAHFFTQEFQRLGGTIAAQEAYQGGDTDFRAQLTSIKSADPQSIFVPGYYNDAANVCKQARSLGIELPLLGGDGWSDPALFKLGGDAVNGACVSDHYSAENEDPAVQKFVQSYRARFGETPSGLSACGYDAAKILCDAIARAGSTEPRAIRDALAATHDFPGVTGRITINEQHNAVKPATVVRAEAGEFKYVATISP